MVLTIGMIGPLLGLPPSVPPTASARATLDEKPRIAIAPIGYSATIPDHTRMAVHATVTDAVKTFAHSALVLDVDADCRTRECALRQARDANAEFLLELGITVDQRDYEIEMVVLAVSDGRLLTESSGECRLCAQAELLVEITAQVASLEATLDDELRPVASLGSEPPSSRALSHFEPASERRPSNLEIGGWVGIALGIAGAGTGVVLLAIDGRDHGPTCAAEARDINGACPNVYTTQLAGIVSTTAGSVVLATGTGLVIAGKRKRRSEAAARLTPTLGGLRLNF